MLMRPTTRQRRSFALLLLSLLVSPAVLRAELVYVNGIAIELRSLTVRGEPRAAALQLAERWRRRQPAANVTLMEAGGGVVVGRQRGALHETALFKRGASLRQSEVTVSAVHLGVGVRALPRAPFELPRGSQLLSVVETVSGSGTSAEFVIAVGRSVALTHTAARSAVAAADWTVQASEPIRAVRKGESLVVVVQPLNRGSALVIQHRRSVGA